jgi:hypothetical protein
MVRPDDPTHDAENPVFRPCPTRLAVCQTTVCSERQQAVDILRKEQLDSQPIQMEDPRYEGLHTRGGIEVEDCRFNSVAIAMEDPRCRSKLVSW